MYLALKMGAIQENSQQNAPLPVIVDDALVNSDPGRARAAAEGIAKLGDTNQVLVFTCHPTLVQQFQEARPDAQVHKLDLQMFEPSRMVKVTNMSEMVGDRGLEPLTPCV